MLVVSYGQFMMHGQRNIKLFLRSYIPSASQSFRRTLWHQTVL